MKNSLLYNRKVDELAQSEQNELFTHTHSLLFALREEIVEGKIENSVQQITTTTFLVSGGNYVHHIADCVSEKCITLRTHQLKPSLSYLGVF